MSTYSGPRWHGPKEGTCNICGTFGPLTNDHVPPKGSIKPKARELQKLGDHLGGGEITRVHMQSGIKFRSICATCNNHLLGLQYDPSLNEFSRKAASLIRATRHLEIPRLTTVRVRPQRIARSVVGHLLAAEIRECMTEPPPSAPFQDALRGYFLDSTSSLPENIDITYWLYDGDHHVIIRGFGVLPLYGPGLMTCDLLKYFPLAFLVTFQLASGVEPPGRDLVPIRSMGLDDEADLTIQLRPRPRVGWPEQPNDDEVVLFNNGVAYLASAPH